MTMRYFKIALAAFVALQALVYATQNIANLDAAWQSVAYVLSNQDHVAYGSSFLPAITSPALVWLSLIIILVCEYAAGLLAATGCWRMWQQRQATSEAFQQAKQFALLGCLASVVVWFGLFLVIGGTVFQMWQTELGAGSMNGSFQYSTLSALILIILNQRDDELPGH